MRRVAVGNGGGAPGRGGGGGGVWLFVARLVKLLPFVCDFWLGTWAVERMVLAIGRRER